MQDIRTETEVSAHTESSVKAGKLAKTRIRKRLNITISPENYNWLKERIGNASKFIDSLIDAVKEQTQPAVMVISPVGQSTGRARSLARLERTADNREVRRSNRRGPILNTLNGELWPYT